MHYISPDLFCKNFVYTVLLYKLYFCIYCTFVQTVICEQLPRVSHALCPSKRGLYALAGIDHVVLDGMDRELILDAVEFYDPQENRWRFVRQFPFGCYNTGSIVVDEKQVTLFS